MLGTAGLTRSGMARADVQLRKGNSSSCGRRNGKKCLTTVALYNTIVVGGYTFGRLSYYNGKYCSPSVELLADQR